MKVKDILQFEVSVFETIENTGSNAKMKVLRMFDTILLGNQYINQIENLRRFAGKQTIAEENQYKQLKKHLPVWTVSCLCGNGTRDICKYHNVLCIDIDQQDNVGMDPEQAKQDLMKLPSIFFASLSVGGKGVFALMGLSGSDDFKERFNSVKEYVFKKTGYIIDKSCCNPNRLRIISYDNDFIFKDLDSELVLYPNKKSENQESIYKPVIEISLPKKKSIYDEVDLLNDDKFCISCANYCINRLGMQTTDYTNWLSNIGSLSCLGYDGEQLAIDLSRQSRGYTGDEDVVKTMKRLSDNQRNRQYLTRYFKLCKDSLGKYWIQEIKKMYDLEDQISEIDGINFENHSLINL
jgi:hypothetical protein